MKVRILVAGELRVGATVALDAQAAHHARDVLRLGSGDAVTLLNGLGGEFDAHLTTVSKQTVEATIEAHATREAEARFPITVIQSLATGDKMDWVIEKSVELGASAIWPVAAARSVLKLDDKRAAKRQAHWQAIIRSACEQCGRNRVPTLEPVTSLATALQALKTTAGEKWLLSPVNAQAFGSLSAPAAGTPITLLVGPEAGLSDAEEALARDAGFTPVLLGPRVMRTETAALAALAAIHARFGDF
jgi:16S rRNA (uracil1498-N3)-methyltransferase